MLLATRHEYNASPRMGELQLGRSYVAKSAYVVSLKHADFAQFLSFTSGPVLYDTSTVVIWQG